MLTHALSFSPCLCLLKAPIVTLRPLSARGRWERATPVCFGEDLEARDLLSSLVLAFPELMWGGWNVASFPGMWFLAQQGDRPRV